ncbi:hypothetical protein B0H13DRAFT_2265468 [Mycena leptocephala]|nr:hypothetical protein B0H13DRAFT_2265468 [Mycena leptocephala]
MCWIRITSKCDNVGNEVLTQNAPNAAPLLKAAARDARAYLKSISSPALIGYADIGVTQYLSFDPTGANDGASAGRDGGGARRAPAEVCTLKWGGVVLCTSWSSTVLESTVFLLSVVAAKMKTKMVGARSSSSAARATAARMERPYVRAVQLGGCMHLRKSAPHVKGRRRDAVGLAGEGARSGMRCGACASLSYARPQCGHCVGRGVRLLLRAGTASATCYQFLERGARGRNVRGGHADEDEDERVRSTRGRRTRRWLRAGGMRAGCAELLYRMRIGGRSVGRVELSARVHEARAADEEGWNGQSCCSPLRSSLFFLAHAAGHPGHARTFPSSVCVDSDSGGCMSAWRSWSSHHAHAVSSRVRTRTCARCLPLRVDECSTDLDCCPRAPWENGEDVVLELPQQIYLAQARLSWALALLPLLLNPFFT